MIDELRQLASFSVLGGYKHTVNVILTSVYEKMVSEIHSITAEDGLPTKFCVVKTDQ